jgi:uncharacterized membrane protein
MPMTVFGTEHYLDPIGIGRIIPAWIPAHTFWVYLVGTCLILGRLSIVCQKYAWLSAGLFGVMLLSFEVLMEIPRVVAAPHNRLALALAFRDFSFSWGALAFAATHTGQWRTQGTHWLVTVARICFGVTIVFFAVEYLVHPELLPGVPLSQLTPKLIPGRVLWDYVTSVLYVFGGVCLVVNRKAHVAATWIGLFVLSLVIAFCVPHMIQHASEVGSGLNVPADTLLMSGSALCLAASLRQTPAIPQREPEGRLSRMDQTNSRHAQ